MAESQVLTRRPQPVVAIQPNEFSQSKVSWPDPEIRTGYAISKRLLDITVSSLLMLLLSPFLIAVAFIIWLYDGGAPLFRQRRVGRDGREFDFYKFRSMVVNAEAVREQLEAQNRHDDPRTFKLDGDPRITPFGRFLRKFSVDELPQLWNVFLGDMSLVGPRPPVPQEVDLYTDKDWQRLSVKPGMTGLWQVSGRSNLPFPDQVRLDCEYIQRQGIGFDLLLIAKTIPAVITADGAD